MKIENNTGFAAGFSLLCDESTADVLVIAVKATFMIEPNTKLSLADAQVPVLWADEHYGEPAQSSIKYASDLLPTVSGTDIGLLGFAYPDKPRANAVAVGVQVGQTRKLIKVFGNRVWQQSVGGITTITPPEPFHKIALRYELAFGGIDDSHPDPKNHAYSPHNPIGTGLVAKNSKRNINGLRLPNLEDPNHLVKSPHGHNLPAGVGFINAHWQPRVAFGGTYDALWQKTRMPFLPTDFDKRFYHAGGLGLISPQVLRGNEPCAVTGATPQGILRFNLPNILPKTQLMFKKNSPQSVPLRLGRVTIDAETTQVIIGWYGSFPIEDIYQITALTVTK